MARTTSALVLAPLDVATLSSTVLHHLARYALIGLASGRYDTFPGSAIESDRRSQAKALRDLVAAGWLTSVTEHEHDRLGGGTRASERYRLTPAAIDAIASEPTEALPMWFEERGERLPQACSPVLALVAGFGTYSKPSTDGMRAMVWRLLHHERFQWALVPSERALYQGYCRFPIPLDSSKPIGPQVETLDKEWSLFANNHAATLDLVVSDAATVLRHQQARARNLWRYHRGRTMLAIARFGGYSKGDDDDADESMVDDIPSLGGGFLHTRTPDRYDPKLSWEDEAQRQLSEAVAAIERAQARHAALLKRYTKVAVENPGPRPYDAMRARFEQWIAEYIIAQTGVDPRTLPEEP